MTKIRCESPISFYLPFSDCSFHTSVNPIKNTYFLVRTNCVYIAENHVLLYKTLPKERFWRWRLSRWMPHDNANSGPGSESGMPFPQRFREVGSTLKSLGPKEVTPRSSLVSFFLTIDYIDLAGYFWLRGSCSFVFKQNRIVFCKAKLFIF